jgi:hypothetical protein
MTAAAATDEGLALARRESSTALTPIEEARAIAQVQAAVMVAKRFPRDETAALAKIVKACTRPGLAEVALYEYPKGGKTITGPSIRMAETIAQAWTNFEFGWRELSRGVGPENVGFSWVEACAWDLENVLRRPMTFHVKHWRDTQQGGYALKDEREIYELCANMAARRLRACILNLIPGDVVEAAVNEVERTLSALEATPERVAKMVEAFAVFKVTRAQLETRIGRKLETISPTVLLQLMKIHNSLRDGMSKPGDWFEATAAAASATEPPKRKSEAAQQQQKPAQTPPPPAAESAWDDDSPF